MTLAQFRNKHVYIAATFEKWLGNVAECKLPETAWCSLLTDFYNSVG